MLALEYVQIRVCYNIYTDTCTRTRVNVNADLMWVTHAQEPGTSL